MKTKKSQNIQIGFLLLPGILIFGFFTIYPIVKLFITSFFKWDFGSMFDQEFIGFANYKEVLTDPSYYGQIVTMTYPLIGNYGINLEDNESEAPKVRGFIVREKCSFPNNFRCEIGLEDYLKQNKIIGLEGIDTRALTKILRNNGTMKGIISLESESLDEVKEKIEGFSNKEAVKSVSTKNSYTIEGSGKHVAIIDFGIKANIIRNFKKRGCKITVFPMDITAEEVLAVNPDLIFLSNGSSPSLFNPLHLDKSSVKNIRPNFLVS